MKPEKPKDTIAAPRRSIVELKKYEMRIKDI
jgi:hypothetical protein